MVHSNLHDTFSEWMGRRIGQRQGNVKWRAVSQWDAAAAVLPAPQLYGIPNLRSDCHRKLLGPPNCRCSQPPLPASSPAAGSDGAADTEVPFK